MKRRSLLLGLAVALVTAPLVAGAQPAGKVWRIGYLSVAPVELDKSWVAAFQQGLRELGYVEGQNVVIERHAAGRIERLPELAAELVRLKVDVFVVYGAGRSVAAVKKAGSTAPIVMTVSPDPVGEGLVASLARPGGNVTGLSDSHADLAPKRLELLKEVVPSASRVAVLWNPASGTVLQLKNIQAAARALNVTVLPFEVRGPDEIDRVFAAIGRERPDALLLVPEPAVVRFNQRQIMELTVKNRLPAIGTVRQWAENGFLLSYGTNFSELWRRAATYVDKILKGAKPANLPVEQPTKFGFVINMKTAKTFSGSCQAICF